MLARIRVISRARDTAACGRVPYYCRSRDLRDLVPIRTTGLGGGERSWKIMPRSRPASLAHLDWRTARSGRSVRRPPVRVTWLRFGGVPRWRATSRTLPLPDSPDVTDASVLANVETHLVDRRNGRSPTLEDDRQVADPSSGSPPGPLAVCRPLALGHRTHLRLLGSRASRNGSPA